jgi:hypothetical protein
MKVGLFVKRISQLLVLTIVVMPVAEVRASNSQPSTGEKVGIGIVETAVVIVVGIPLLIIMGGCSVGVSTLNFGLCSDSINLVIKAFSALIPGGSGTAPTYEQIQPQLPDVIKAVARGTGKILTPTQEQDVLDQYNAAYTKARAEMPVGASDALVLRTTMVNVALDNGYKPGDFALFINKVINANPSMAITDVASLRQSSLDFMSKYNAQNGPSVNAKPVTGSSQQPEQPVVPSQEDLKAIAAAKQTMVDNLANGFITKSGISAQIGKLQAQAELLRQQAEESEDADQKAEFEQQAQDLDDQVDGYQQAIDAP